MYFLKIIFNFERPELENSFRNSKTFPEASPPNANVNVSGAQITQLGHGETLIFSDSLFESFLFHSILLL